MLANILSSSIRGMNALLINVEVDLSRGLPSFNIVGLPDKAVRESRERVRSAIINSGLEFPVQKITINLAPASIKKIGPNFDLAIAIGILTAEGKISNKLLNSFVVIGELSLNGDIREVNGILPMALNSRANNLEGIIVPYNNYREANLVNEITVIPVRNLKDVINFLNNGEIIKYQKTDQSSDNEQELYDIDFEEIKGQQEARRALEIAAAGGHNILMLGPPGTGKTMLAKRIRTILPPLTPRESLELTKIHSIMGLTEANDCLIKKRPFRAPHQSISAAGLLGGGRIPEPGEISLAHHGILYLDELPEYKRNVLELLRQPLEEGKIKIIRSSLSATFPARIMLVAAMNPCPCGYYGDQNHECHCTIPQINRYRSKLTGPLLDRIDIQIEVPALSPDEIVNQKKGESSAEIKKRVIKAHEIQINRYEKIPINQNSQLKGDYLKRYCKIKEESKFFLKNTIDRLGLSARGYDRILRMSRTIADLDESPEIKQNHLAEAIQYRNLSRKIY